LAELSPQLKAVGYCVFALNYGGAPGLLFQGYGDIAASAAQLGAFVDSVLKATGASAVDMVGTVSLTVFPAVFISRSRVPASGRRR